MEWDVLFRVYDDRGVLSPSLTKHMKFRSTAPMPWCCHPDPRWDVKGGERNISEDMLHHLRFISEFRILFRPRVTDFPLPNQITQRNLGIQLRTVWCDQRPVWQMRITKLTRRGRKTGTLTTFYFGKIKKTSCGDRHMSALYTSYSNLLWRRQYINILTIKF